MRIRSTWDLQAGSGPNGADERLRWISHSYKTRQYTPRTQEATDPDRASG